MCIIIESDECNVSIYSRHNGMVTNTNHKAAPYSELRYKKIAGDRHS